MWDPCPDHNEKNHFGLPLKGQMPALEIPSLSQPEQVTQLGGKNLLFFQPHTCKSLCEGKMEVTMTFFFSYAMRNSPIFLKMIGGK